MGAARSQASKASQPVVTTAAARPQATDTGADRWPPAVAGDLAQVVADLPIGVAVVLADGTVGARNREAAAVFASADSATIAMTMRVLCVEAARARGAAEKTLLLGDGGELRVRVIPAPNGIDFVATLDRRGFGDAERHEARLRAIVEAERTRSAALAAEMVSKIARAEQLAGLGRLVAQLAHEVNNPLAALMATVDLMKMIVANAGSTAPAVTADLAPLLADCTALIDRVRDLMRSVNGMSRDASGDDVVFDPSRAIRDAVRLFALAKRHDCDVELSLAALPAMQGSPTKLGQVLLNLLQNGLDASGERAHLSVRARCEGATIRISVTDSGSGIPDDIAARIFEPFFTSKASDKGTGLGLSICRDIVTEMGGTIAFETSASGTTFHVAVPAYRQV